MKICPFVVFLKNIKVSFNYLPSNSLAKIFALETCINFVSKESSFWNHGKANLKVH